MNLNAYGGRRFIMCMGCAIVCTFLVWFNKISGGEFVAIILGTVAAYITGNTMQKVKESHDNANSNEGN